MDDIRELEELTNVERRTSDKTHLKLILALASSEIFSLCGLACNDNDNNNNNNIGGINNNINR